MNQKPPWIAWADWLAQTQQGLVLGQLSLEPISKFVLAVVLVLAAGLSFLSDHFTPLFTTR